MEISVVNKRAFLLLAATAIMCEIAVGNPPKPASAAAHEQTLEKPQPQYRLLDTPCSYELIWRPRCLNVWPNEELIRLSQGDDRPQSGPWVYNWVARRDPMFLVSGDLPRFAMMRTYRTPDINPSYVKLGDLRIRLTVEGITYWLDEVDPITARFFPWGTIHEAKLGKDALCTVRVLATLVQNRGIGIRVNVSTDSEVADVVLELFYGGLSVKQPQLSSSYIDTDSADSQEDAITLTGEGARITSSLNFSSPLQTDPSEVPVTVRIVANPPGSARVTSPEDEGGVGSRLVLRHQLTDLRAPRTFHFIATQIDLDPSSAQQADIRIDQFNEYLTQTQKHYEALLTSLAIQTPDPVLDSAFCAAAVNLEYTYQAPAWLEGLHKWNSYLVNNYQISAAICMGQLERARDALLFIGDRPEGPGPNLKSDGSIFMTDNHRVEEGLIYFILQLHRYWQATNDKETLNVLWEPTVKNLEQMLRARDPDGNALINWHQGCNMFLYQADHLSLPGDASSPSIMAADILERMADMADARGEQHRSAPWRRRAEHMRSEILRRLWDVDQGKFVAAIDPQGKSMAANYYTDFVYPQLYSRLPAEYAWISLKTLDQTLWLEQRFMRTGNFKPPLFGNDQVHPLQMAEAAEAYFQAGRAADGAQLLHGVARAVTVLTDSPGSFPERMSDRGFGQPDYGFGNPAGSYVRAVVGGLFGLEQTASNRPLQWRPTIPVDWESASLLAGDTEMEINGRHGDRRYKIKLADRKQAIDLRIPLYGHRVKKVLDASGQDLPYIQVAHPGGGFLELQLKSAAAHTVQLISQEQKIDSNIPAYVKPGESIVWTLPEKGMTVTDSQAALAVYKIEGRTLTGRLSKAERRKHLFLTSSNNDRVIPIELDFGVPKPQEPPIVLQGERESISLESLFNSESINCHNFWAVGPKQIDLSANVISCDSGYSLSFGEYSFAVKPSGQNIIQLEIGDLTLYELELKKLSEKPQAICFPVEKAIHGVDFLMASDFKIRLTNMEVGRIIFHYADGSRLTEPLIYGHNVDCFIKSFASGVKSFERNWLSHLAAFSVQVDSSRILSRIEVKIDTTDGNLGILATNLVLPIAD